MKIGIKILGCPKNTADCEILAAVLKRRGHEIVESAEEADLVIIDTCTFIEGAKRESIDTILDFVYYKKSKKDLKIAVKGCMVQRYYNELKKEIPEVDTWIGVAPPNVVADAIGDLRDRVFNPNPVYENHEHLSLEKTPYSYVKIADGCDRNCTFCTIPSFKGRYKSRTKESIIKEVGNLVSNGKKEIVLVSQDSTAYGKDIYENYEVTDLLRDISRISGDFWIRLMYIHPDYISEKLINTILDTEKVVPYFEIPVQHGSDKILRRMGRLRRRRELENIFKTIRDLSGEATIRTTVMVGFPGESEEDFQQLLDFLETVHPDRMGVFLYSNEEGTVAYTFRDKVDIEIARERQEIVTALSWDLMLLSNERWIGKKIRVLTEEDSGEVVGRSWMDAPEIDGFVELDRKVDPGKFVEVKVEGANDCCLEGRIIG